MPKKTLGAILVAILLLVCSLSVGALPGNNISYPTYDYNFYEESIAAPAAYAPAGRITGASLTEQAHKAGHTDVDLGNFQYPTDIFYDEDNKLIYMLDSLSSLSEEDDVCRLIVLNDDYTYNNVIYFEEPGMVELTYFDIVSGTEVPVLDENGDPIVVPECEPLLDEDGMEVWGPLVNPITGEEVLDADGWPVEVPLTDPTKPIIRDSEIKEAEGFTIGKDGRIYIADTKGMRIAIFKQSETDPHMATLINEIIPDPEETHQDEELPFDVCKVIVDNRNNLYAIARSNNMGAFVFDSEGHFQRFFGGNEVEKTGEVVMKYLLRPFLTQAQLEGMTTSTPINIASFDVDDEGFLYTCTTVAATTEVPEGVIRKLNYLSKNILDAEIVFGDLEWDRLPASSTKVTNFIDLDVDDYGFINMLDTNRGKIFQYTERGELVAVFGAYGDQVGTFDKPVAVESIGDAVLIVDANKRLIQIFKPTAYGAKYRDALVRLEDDDYEGSLAIWNSLLEANSNNAHAYYGVGHVYDMMGEYGKAMEYFKLAGDRDAYSNAFQEYRNLLIKDLFLPVVLVVIALFIGLQVLKRVRGKKVKERSTSAYSKLESKYTFPLYTLFHPADGFQQLKPRKIGSWRVVGILMVALFFVFTLQFFATGFIFNLNRMSDYSLPIMLLKTAGIGFLFILSNWAVCTLFNGNGNLKEIACVTTYSLLPFIGAMLINVVASNFLTASEGAIMDIILVVGILWSVLLLLSGLAAIHEYTMTQSLFSTIATVIGMAVIVFLLIMFFSLMQQTVSFFQSILDELINR
ncbi:MAG: YIP1 family protein [Clostridia bacterium]|nr:YIP1 family protein [Clostridia bacterium]